MSSSGVVSRRLRRVISLNILLVFDIVLSSCTSTASADSQTPSAVPGTDTVIITILNTNVQKAVARVLFTTDADSLADDNKLSLQACRPEQQISVWSPGFYIETFRCDGRSEYAITLTQFQVADNANYTWTDADIRTDPLRNCQGCHSDLQGRSEHAEWKADGHSKVFLEPYFSTIYTGTDVFRNPGSETVWKILDSGQKLRIRSDSKYGPGFRLDYPGDNGNCAFCHAPAAVKVFNQTVDLTGWNNNLPGTPINVETEGITCDVCHKVVDVLLGQDGRPYVERPGVLSFSFVELELNQLFSVGPLADYKPENAETRSTCSPVFSESKFCAACHYGKFFDTVIYDSYGEWLESGYSNKETGNYRSCQDCHMPSAQEIGNSAPQERAACSEANHSFRSFNHNMMRRNLDGIPTLVKDAATIGLIARIEDGRINVAVDVQSVGVGHKFPTDSPLRHLILLVEAKDQNGTLLAQVGGPMIPLWGGVGSNPEEDYAGRPGEIYANILTDRDTNLSPTVAYWNPTLPAWTGSDTRLNPGEPTQSEYSFAVPSNGAATITARLIYRYAFIDIMRQKSWDRDDIEVTMAEKVVP